ncbi:hypothetical protein GCM10010156_55800 [Planobispora rosea]|uniref:Uncharacterized protein n=1 Tax=Planobispora rosea TaxID=35762 RepID=A0A8J3S532_PLARO|nr:hypothetical protein [Planobispora rosea]GGS90261.1 hypothetical protein GCM10010156_55800 [Planobispora rosea]GIH86954.1 hypothetical protein Pro02_53620 [Planobispora rosea]
MWIAASIVAGVVLVIFVAVLTLVVISIHVEDNRSSITGRAPGATTAGARRLLGVKVDHSLCMARPRDACPLCRRLLLKEGMDDTPGRPGSAKPYPDEITGS